MNLKILMINVALCIVISNCSEPQIQKPSLDVASLRNYLSGRSDFKNVVSITAHNNAVFFRMTTDERNLVLQQLNDLVEQRNIDQIVTLTNSKGIILDENRYLQNLLSDLTSKFTYSNDDFNTIMNEEVNLSLSYEDSSGGRIEMVPPPGWGDGCAAYCQVGQINYENDLIARGDSASEARMLGSTWYVGCVYGCNYQP